MQVAFVVLTDCDETSVIAESSEKTIEPRGYVAAAATHELYLFTGDDDTLEHGDLPSELVGESRRVDCVVAVIELISDLCAGIVVDDSAAHGEFI